MIRWYTDRHYLGWANSSLGWNGLEVAIYCPTFPARAEQPDSIAAEVLAERFNRLEESFELWREWFEDDPYPRGESNCCVFCGQSMDGEHSEDCIYIRAKILMEEARLDERANET